MPPRPPRGPGRGATFIDPERIERLLEPWIVDARDRGFVVRCLLEEGPHHHRGANYVLLALLGELQGRQRRPSKRRTRDVTVPMRLPPHLLGHDDQVYPLRLPTEALERLAAKGSPAFDAMIDCLTDGPPHHALANVAMIAILTALLEGGIE